MRPQELITRVVPFLFGCIGVTILVFLWTQPFGQFGSPPLFFRVVGSFIALAFTIIGFTGAIYGSTGRLKERLRSLGAAGREAPRPSEGGFGYACPGCGAPLATGADVSPSGDVKCSYCERWFNVHAAGPNRRES